MKRIIYLFTIILALGFSSCSEDPTIYHTAAEVLFDTDKEELSRGETVSFTDKSVPTKGSGTTNIFHHLKQNYKVQYEECSKMRAMTQNLKLSRKCILFFIPIKAVQQLSQNDCGLPDTRRS